MIKRERKKHLDIRGWLRDGEDVDGLKSLKCWLYFILFWQEMDAMWSGAYIFSCFICSRHGGTWEILVQNANRERFIHNEHATKSLEHDHRDLQKKGGAWERNASLWHLLPPPPPPSATTCNRLESENRISKASPRIFITVHKCSTPKFTHFYII